MSKIWPRRHLAALSMITPALTLTCGDVSAAPSMRDCARITQGNLRLACYDQVMYQDAPSTQHPTTPHQVAEEPPIEPEQPAETRSPIQRNWLFNNGEKAASFRVTAYKPNYFLVYTYSASPNEQPYRGTSQPGHIDESEIKFQLSLKTRLAHNLFGSQTSLWFGYTQLAYFQAYNTDYSSPFRETDYEPELLLTHPLDLKVPFGLTGRLVTFGVNHQSNGRSEPLSRSWNRLTAGVLFDRDDFVMGLRTWVRLPENENKDDNPDIEDYYGRAELTTAYAWGDKTLAAVLRNNLSTDQNRGSLQLDFSFPLFESVKGYFQLFGGYGESLIDFDHYNNRVGAGVMLTDWF